MRYLLVFLCLFVCWNTRFTCSKEQFIYTLAQVVSNLALTANINYVKNDSVKCKTSYWQVTDCTTWSITFSQFRSCSFVYGSHANSGMCYCFVLGSALILSLVNSLTMFCSKPFYSIFFPFVFSGLLCFLVLTCSPDYYISFPNFCLPVIWTLRLTMIFEHTHILHVTEQYLIINCTVHCYFEEVPHT